MCARLTAAYIVAAGWMFCSAQTNVLTQHNDTSRTGQNLTETILTPANVNAATFGQLGTFYVDGFVYAQPLYVASVSMRGRSPVPVVYAATENDSVYAFSPVTGNEYWQVSLLGRRETPSDIRNCNNLTPQMGITATPVIDLNAGPHGTIYVEAMSKDRWGNYHHRLHALDITNGREEFNGPAEITATYPGTGENSLNGTVYFTPGQELARAGLLVYQGSVYMGFGGICDHQPYSGWLIGYNETTLSQTGALDFAPNGEGAGLWQGGGGIAVGPGGDLFVSIGNGTFDTGLTSLGFPAQGDYGNALVKLVPSGNFTVADYWTMSNTVAESAADEDLGSGGVVILPNLENAQGKTYQLAVAAGKDKNIYVFNPSAMGKFNPNNNNALYQQVIGALGGGEFGIPAWFNGTLYFSASKDVIRAFPVQNAQVSSTPSSMGSEIFGYPGSTPAISANGTRNAILWTIQSYPGILRAYDATNLANELYNTTQAPNGRDALGTGVKFTVPTIADGRVIVGTTNGVVVYTLLSSSATSKAEGFRRSAAQRQ